MREDPLIIASFMLAVISFFGALFLASESNKMDAVVLYPGEQAECWIVKDKKVVQHTERTGISFQAQDGNWIHLDSYRLYQIKDKNFKRVTDQLGLACHE